MSNPQVELHIKNYGVITLELDARQGAEVGRELPRAT